MAWSKEEYNQEPVHYCVSCLSLNIIDLHGTSLCVCGECGNVDIEETDINNWIEMYDTEYGKAFLPEEDLE